MQARAGGAEPEAERAFVIRREFDAPARLLFEAYTKPEHIKQWFGPRGWPVTLAEIDFRVGGRFRFQMTGPDGEKGDPFGGEYLEIIPGRKIVYDNGFELPDAERMIVTVSFEEHGGKTTLTVHTLFESVAMKDRHLGLGYEVGTRSALDQLAEWAARHG